MATQALTPGDATMPRPDDRFFMTMAVAMALTAVAGFSLQFLMGRSTFASPPLVHAHAIVFFGWIVIYLLQTWLATQGPVALHRRLGWLSLGWIAMMLVLGFAVTIAMVRRGQVPFIFQPQHFLIFDPGSLIGFASMIGAGIALRRRTDWHRRMNLCAMAMLLGPATGRLLPMPLLIPYAFEAAHAATFVFPAIGMVADRRRDGRVHPAWFWGMGAMLMTGVAIDVVTHSPLGDALYRAVTAGSPGADVAPLEFPPPPDGPLITGRTTAM